MLRTLMDLASQQKTGAADDVRRPAAPTLAVPNTPGLANALKRSFAEPHESERTVARASTLSRHFLGTLEEGPSGIAKLTDFGRVRHGNWMRGSSRTLEEAPARYSAASDVHAEDAERMIASKKRRLTLNPANARYRFA
jgi:hypothetical protein